MRIDCGVGAFQGTCHSTFSARLIASSLDSSLDTTSTDNGPLHTTDLSRAHPPPPRQHNGPTHEAATLANDTHGSGQSMVCPRSAVLELGKREENRGLPRTLCLHRDANHKSSEYSSKTLETHTGMARMPWKGYTRSRQSELCWFVGLFGCVEQFCTTHSY